MIKPEKMFPLSDKKEKEEKIDPEGIHKVPENGCQTEAEMVFRGVSFLRVFHKNPNQHHDPCKDVQQVGPRDHIEERGSHIALRTCGVQARLDQLVEAIELVEHKGQPENQREPQEDIRPGVIP